MSCRISSTDEPSLQRRFANEEMPAGEEGENVGLSQTVAGAASRRSWILRRIAHNLLNPNYNTIGVGIMRRSGNGLCYRGFRVAPAGVFRGAGRGGRRRRDGALCAALGNDESRCATSNDSYAPWHVPWLLNDSSTIRRPCGCPAFMKR